MRKLGFEETPDYDFLRELFAKVMKNMNEVDDQRYDWNELNGGRGWESQIVRLFHSSENTELIILFLLASGLQLKSGYPGQATRDYRARSTGGGTAATQFTAGCNPRPASSALTSTRPTREQDTAHSERARPWAVYRLGAEQRRGPHRRLRTRWHCQPTREPAGHRDGRGTPLCVRAERVWCAGRADGSTLR